MERDAYDRPERTVKFLCDERCNKCVVMENRQVALLMNVLLEVYGDGVYEIANSICPNMTCCPDCHIDDFCHKGDDGGRGICEIEREARRIARSFIRRKEHRTMNSEQSEKNDNGGIGDDVFAEVMKICFVALYGDTATRRLAAGDIVHALATAYPGLCAGRKEAAR